MTGTPADTLADTSNPDVVEQFLRKDHIKITTPNPSINTSTSQTLSDLFDRYFKRSQNQSPATLGQYKRTIPDFIEFAEENNVTLVSEVSVEIVDQYVDHLQSEYDSDATILTYTKNVRAWLRWLHKRNLCTESVYQILNKDDLGLVPKARDEALPESTATEILSKLRTQRRGSAMHALMEVLWNAGPRIGGVHSLDLQDFVPEIEELQFVHRPESGTRLKNGRRGKTLSKDGERNVVLRDSVIDALQRYISECRPDVTDEYGRKPLFATKNGRPSKSTLRRWVYVATSCRWAPTRDSDHTCDGDCDPDSDVCVYSYYPHAIRRGSIVHHLSGGLRPDRASERFDVSTKIIKKHYDPRTKRQRKEDREEAVRDAW